MNFSINDCEYCIHCSVCRFYENYMRFVSETRSLLNKPNTQSFEPFRIMITCNHFRHFDEKEKERCEEY
jgi:hypothetical protein